jgi:MoaE-MoaD fusion protein
VHIKVLFFGILRDMTGQSECELELAPGTTAAGVFDHFAAQFPVMETARHSTMVARNQEFSKPEAVLRDGDEVALLPPVSGGSGPWVEEITTDPLGNFYGLTTEALDAASLARKYLQNHDGAFVNFEGVVRDNTKGRPTLRLEYDCYRPMAIKLMAQLGDEIALRHQISRMVIVHRLGRMEIGETSVAVIAFSPHRRQAFEAALEGINRLKKIVPIWKKEFFADGEVWVEGEWDEKLRVV